MDQPAFVNFLLPHSETKKNIVFVLAKNQDNPYIAIYSELK